MNKFNSIVLNQNKPFYNTAELKQNENFENSFYLNNDVDFSNDPSFYGGVYMLHQTEKLIIKEIFKQLQSKSDSPLKVLDVAGSFGANTTLISSVISSDSFVVCNESNKQKIPQLYDNITRWGLANVIVSNNNETDFRKIEGFFDVIFIDHTNKYDSSRINNMFEYVISALRPGGILIYTSTKFTATQSEEFSDLAKSNELRNYELKIEEKFLFKNENISTIINYSSLIEHSDFQFICLEKPFDELARGSALRKMKIDFFHNRNRVLIEDWVDDNEKYDLLLNKEDVLAIPKSIVNEYALLSRYLNISKVGVVLGKVLNGKSFIPSHELSMFNGISPNVSSIDVDLESALLFLKRQDFPILPTFSSGWQLVKYKNANLGLIKVIGNRMNNYYPKDIKLVKEL